MSREQAHKLTGRCLPFIKKLIIKYVNETPTLKKTLSIIKSKYPIHPLPIDHIAFRTYDIRLLDKFLIINGFKKMNKYTFPENDKYAHWYKHKYLPKIFVSQLNNEKFKEEINEINKKIKTNNYSKKQIYFLHKQVSQYLAWLYAHGEDDINHIAFSTHYLPDSIRDIYYLLKENNIKMETYQISQDKKLTQFSTIADKVDNYPKSFVEFIERKPIIEDNNIYKINSNDILPFNTTINEHLFIENYINNKIGDDYRRDGFDSMNAEAIFNSTK